jgi:hypothetical protein
VWHDASVSHREWLDQHLEQVAATRQARSATSLAIATFATGVAATLVASALQDGKISEWDLRSAILLGLAGLSALGVAGVNRERAVDYVAVLLEAQTRGWDGDRIVAELRIDALTASIFNEGVRTQIRRVLLAQLLLAAASSSAAALSLLT